MYPDTINIQSRRPQNYPYAAMPSYSLSRSTSPPTSTKPFRFSIHRDRDAQRQSVLHQSSPHIATTSTSTHAPSGTRRASKIPDLIMSGLKRGRTTSLPPRPQSAEGRHNSSELETVSMASSSFASDVDPFAAHPSQSQATSFVTYDSPSQGRAPSSSAFRYSSAASSRRPFMSRPTTAASHSLPVSSPFSSDATTTTVISSPTKRRSSVLVSAASDALSSLSSMTRRKKPLSRSSFSPSSSRTYMSSNNHPPILFSEVIEISAETAKKLREEERERERLRDAAAQTLGLGPVLLEHDPVFTKSRRGGEDDEDDVQVGIVPMAARRGPEALLQDDEDEYQFRQGDEERARPLESNVTGSSGMSLKLSTPIQPNIPATPLTPTRSVSAMGSQMQQQPPGSPTLSVQKSPSHSHSRTRSIGHGRHSPSNSFSMSLTPLTPMNPAINGISGSPTHSNLTSSSSPAGNGQIPPFPSTLEALKPHISLSGTFPKHYPPSTLLRFAFGTKQWKSRYVVLTIPAQCGSPTTPTPNAPTGRPSTASSSTSVPGGGGVQIFRTNTPPSPSYLHLFKSNSPGAVEIERLEINEDSVVFIADSSPLDSSHSMSASTLSPSSSSTAVAGSSNRRASSEISHSAYVHAAGGRKGVIQVGGVDAGLHIVTGSSAHSSGKHKERDMMSDVDGTGGTGRTMWLLQIMDSEDARKWIAAIKGVVLSQRSLRAGLPHSSVGAFFEPPRGDLDVMLSMRAQQASLVASSSQSYMSGSSNDHMGTITPRVQSPVQSLFHGTDNGLSLPSSLSRSHSRGTGNTAGANATTSGSRTAGNGAVSALKGLFTNAAGRPRSPSSASAMSVGSVHDNASPNTTLDIVSQTKPTEDTSFGSIGTNLLMLRSNSLSPVGGDAQRPGFGSPTSSVFSPMSPSTPTTAQTSSIGSPTSKLAEYHPSLLLDRRIIHDDDLPIPMEHLKPFTSSSLQPPPRRRAWTSSGLPSLPKRSDALSSPSASATVTPPTSAVAALTLTDIDEGRSVLGTPPPMYTYTHANESTAESFGVGVPQRSLSSASGNGSANGNSNGSVLPSPRSPSTEGSRSRARMSWSSTSSFASNDPTSSPEVYPNSRRWSRHNQSHHLLTPGGSPPATSPLSPSSSVHSHRLSGVRHHPYLADQPSPGSRSSSIQSSSPPSLVLDLRPLSPKRTSGSSAQSDSTTTSTGTGHSRPATSPAVGMARNMFRRNSHRLSVPPPQRPVPISALPPTPNGDGPSSGTPNSIQAPSITQTSSAPPAKTSFKDMLTSRRLSFSPPSHPAPTTSLPPRPDEATIRATHRRSLGNGNGNAMTPLHAISASPKPPPNGPLPPTPALTNTTPTQASIDALSSGSQSNNGHPKSFVHRLRILSAPSSSPPTPPIASSSTAFDDSSQPASFMPLASPIPNAGPITTSQHELDASSDSPIVPPPSRLLGISLNSPPPPEVSPSDETLGITSLSPPPRRGSRRIATPDKEKLEHEVVRLSSVVTLKDVRRSQETTPPPSPLPLPPSPLSPPARDQPSPERHESPDQSIELDNATISTASPPNSPLVHSSPGRSAVSLIDVGI